MTLDDIPNDLFEQILSFISNDYVSIGRVSLTCQSLYRRIAFESPDLWKLWLQMNWQAPCRRAQVEGSVFDLYQNDSEVCDSSLYRAECLRRFRMDRDTIRALNDMTEELRESLGILEDGDTIDAKSHVRKVWSVPSWHILRDHGWQVHQELKKQARNSSSPTLYRYVAARALQTIHFSDRLDEWLHILKRDTDFKSVPNRLESAVTVEDYAILVCELQETPLNLLSEDASPRTVITRKLDEMAKECSARLSTGQSMTEKLEVVKDYILNEQGFAGNVDDYYNRENSLLNSVIESKKGIPLSLCILVMCVCRRLAIPVHITGLPGHIVLGMFIDDDESQFFDVFRGGRVLTRGDCRAIVNSYNVLWSDMFCAPLSPIAVLTRMLNNLRNSSMMNAENDVVLPFQSDLEFQASVLRAIHQRPREVVSLLVSRLATEIHTILSPNLLREYGLLSGIEFGS